LLDVLVNVPSDVLEHCSGAEHKGGVFTDAGKYWNEAVRKKLIGYVDHSLRPRSYPPIKRIPIVPSSTDAEKGPSDSGRCLAAEEPDLYQAEAVLGPHLKGGGSRIKRKQNGEDY